MEDAQNRGTLNAKFQPKSKTLESEKKAGSRICPCDIHGYPSGVRKSKYSPPLLIMDAEEQRKTTIHTRQSK
ncbi:hypothetical protein D5086_020038 [Populus alba]|uniref:Uncharacterized protein n=1 Tax=Populus alba TaxID=43335 RepID=A0ACC4BJ03_POPAL